METSPALKNSWLRALLVRKRFSQHNKNQVMHYKIFFLNIIDYNSNLFKLPPYHLFKTTTCFRRPMQIPLQSLLYK